MRLQNKSALVAAFCLGAAAMALMNKSAVAATADAGVYRMLVIFGDALNSVEKFYVRPVDSEKLVRAALDGMLSSLDSRSGYLSPEELRKPTVAKPVREPTVSMVDGVVVVSLPQFVTRAPDRVSSVVAETLRAYLEAKGMVLDLRDNEGGLLADMIATADLFLDGGPIATTRSRAGDDKYVARPGDILDGRPMVVVVNGKTAAGAEIVAGAIQARGRGQIVGTPSAGVASVQTVIPLRKGEDGFLKLTTSRVELPSGRSFEGAGLAPDLSVASAQTKDDAGDAILTSAVGRVVQLTQAQRAGAR